MIMLSTLSTYPNRRGEFDGAHMAIDGRLYIKLPAILRGISDVTLDTVKEYLP